MKWCVEVRAEAEEINAAICEAATYGRELAAAVGSTDLGGRVFLMFRPIPRDQPAHVTATIVDRNGYAR
jgi:hypothetical protein